MASILGKSQLNLFNTILTDGSPQSGTGTAAAVGTIGQDSNNGELYFKHGVTDTQWHRYTLPYGEFFQTVERVTPVGTTTPAFVSYLILTTPSLPAGTYMWMVSGGVDTSGGGTDSSVRVVVDGSTPLNVIYQSQPSVANGRQLASAYDIFTGAGVHTIDVQFNQPAGGGTATMEGMRISVWRVDA